MHAVQTYESTIKVPGGKFLRVRSAIVDAKLTHPQLSGDFFLVPPDSLPAIEQFLHGWDLTVSSNEDQLTNRLQKFLAREQLFLDGIDARTIAHVVDSLREQAGIQKRTEVS